MDRKSPFHQDGASVVPCRDPGHGAGQSPAARRVWAMAEPQPGSALTCVFTSFFFLSLWLAIRLHQYSKYSHNSQFSRYFLWGEKSKCGNVDSNIYRVTQPFFAATKAALERNYHLTRL